MLPAQLPPPAVVEIMRRVVSFQIQITGAGGKVLMARVNNSHFMPLGPVFMAALKAEIGKRKPNLGGVNQVKMSNALDMMMAAWVQQNARCKASKEMERIQRKRKTQDLVLAAWAESPALYGRDAI